MAKGQAFLSDFAVSMALFGVIIVAFFIPWNTVLQADSRFDASETMKTEARRTAAFLVGTPGYPSDWEESGVNVTIPGFAIEDNKLNYRKIMEFDNMSYDRQRSLLKAINYYMELTSDGEIMKVGGRDAEYGRNPLNDSYDPETTVVVSRNVIVNNGSRIISGKLSMVMWR